MGERPTRADRRLWIAALLVFVVALGLRWGHLVALRASFAGTDLFSIPLVDAKHHWTEALAILDGDSPLAAGVPWKGPGYSYFLAALAAVFGRSIAAVRWPLAVLGAFNCALLVGLARRVLDLRAAVAAGILAAVNGVLIVYDTEPYQPTLLITLNLGALACLGVRKPSAARSAGGGVLLGLAGLVHPSYLVPAALLALWTFRERKVRGLAMACAVAATVAPVSLNNLVVHGEPTLISWNGGANVYAANHPTFDQRAGNGTQAWGRILRSPVDAGIESVAARDRLYYRLTVERALRYPVATVGVLIEKAIVFFAPVEYASNFRIYDLREHSPVIAVLLARWGPLGIPFGLWAPAALIGIVLMWRDRSGLMPVIGLWALGVWLSNVLVFNTARFRAPIVCVGCIWVAGALATAARAWSGRHWRRLGVGAVVYALLGALLGWNAVPQRELPLPYEWYEAQALTPAGPYEQAARWADRAVDRDPDSASLLLFVSGLHGRWDRRERERDLLRRALALPDLEPDTIDAAHERLAASFYADGRFDAARAELLEALAVGVDDARWQGYPHYRLGLGPIRSCVLRRRLADVESRRGDPALAREVLESVRADCPGMPGRL